MTGQVPAIKKQQTAITILQGELQKQDVKKRFEDMLGKKAAGFMSSILSLATSKKEFLNVNPRTVLSSAAIAASLDLPINPNLGFAYVIPYGDQAQFQIGYKGIIQLALRTGQYKRINCIPIYESQFEAWNALTEELKADFSVEGQGKVIGFVFYFKLVNGFEKTVYRTKNELLTHGQRYSKAFKSGPWQTNQDDMCMKTLIKGTLSKYGILSIEMQKAIETDQAVIKEDGTADYVDANIEETQALPGPESKETGIEKAKRAYTKRNKGEGTPLTETATPPGETDKWAVCERGYQGPCISLEGCQKIGKTQTMIDNCKAYATSNK